MIYFFFVGINFAFHINTVMVATLEQIMSSHDKLINKRLLAVKKSGYRKTSELSQEELGEIKSRKYALQQMARIQGNSGVEAGRVKAAAFKNSTGKIQTDLAGQLNKMEPKVMHNLWSGLSQENRATVRESVLAEPRKYPQTFHNIFHRQRKGVGKGLAGYNNQ